MSEMGMRDQKDRLRRRAAALPKVDVPHLVEQFLALPQVEGADTVMVFYGVGRELDTRALIGRLLSMGKRVALPVCLPGRRLEARAITSLGDLGPGMFGIPAPEEGCPVVEPAEIGVVLVPNLLCDRAGYRLGFGGGYYDRWLAGYAGLSVVICPRDRLVDELPHEGFDVPVKLVLSD